MIAAGFGFKAADTGRSRRSVLGNPVAEQRFRSDETALTSFGFIPLVAPNAVLQKTHAAFSLKISCLKILESLEDFLTGVHDKRSASGYRLIQPLAGNQQKPAA